MSKESSSSGTVRHPPPPGQANHLHDQLNLAQNLLREGRLVEAEGIYRQLLRKHPLQPILMHDCAQILRARGQLGEAAALLRQAITLAPRQSLLRLALGDVLFQADDRVGAEACFRKALSLDKDNKEILYKLAIVLQSLNRDEEALEKFRQLLADVPDHTDALINSAALLRKRGDLGRALECIDNALVKEPDRYESLYYRAWILSDLRRYEEALVELRRIRKMRPDSFEVALATANALREMGRYDQALSAYWHVLELQPERVETHRDLNQLAWMAGRKDLFLQSFEFARTRLGDHPNLLLLEAAFELRRERPQVAEHLLRRALQLAPERGDITGLLARSLVAQSRYEESYDLFTLAIHLEPKVILHRQELGYALLRDHQARRALAVFEEALKIKPLDQLLLAGLALAYRELDDQRYYTLVDFQRFVRVFDLHLPAGFGPQEFNKHLAEDLKQLHQARLEPIDQTLRGGTQTVGRLFDQPLITVQRVREAILEAIDEYVRDLPQNSQHPVCVRGGSGFDFTGSWSCWLRSGGFHSNHVHPQGWISSAYYVSVPSICDQVEQRQGWLKFGESNLALSALDKPGYYVRPVVGRLVLFPSFYWHGTVPFIQEEERVTIAFDVVPLGRFSVQAE